jgi:hypothetical protein
VKGGGDILYNGVGAIGDKNSFICLISFNEHNGCCSVQVQAGHTPTVEVLKLMEAFTNEDNFTVWSTINNCLSKLSSLLAYTDYEDLFKAYGRRLMQGVYSRTGWDPRDNESEYVDKPCCKELTEITYVREREVIHVGFEVFTVVVMKIIVFWDMTPCSPLSCTLGLFMIRRREYGFGTRVCFLSVRMVLLHRLVQLGNSFL